jgi:hypothetical protein
LEKAVTDVVIACLRENATAAVEAMDRIEGSCRRLSRDEAPAIPGDVILYDQALHTALARSREYARGGHLTNAFDQFVWVMRSCRNCHEMARRNGLLPGTPSTDGAPEGTPRPKP